MYGGVLLFTYALLRETLNKYWRFKYNKIISIMACREFFQENNEEKLIMSDKFIHRVLFGKMNV
ncbi:hypothetical protein CE874_11280 [Salmonella enterica subsp. enterica serovar Napoli]|nr:hypothetical protein [Salmonella enterica]ECS7284959.1 hypothetical protein [Salmonella enterica subsp. enterica serovar Napoli]